ncbi:MAG: hypothetical protein RIQ94_3331 [Pseudomonadota bacterium]
MSCVFGFNSLINLRIHAFDSCIFNKALKITYEVFWLYVNYSG